jgi:hypothetical protein
MRKTGNKEGKGERGKQEIRRVKGNEENRK